MLIVAFALLCQDDVKDLLEKLVSEETKVAEQAQRDLIEIGKSAEAPLRELVKKEPDSRGGKRARHVLEVIEVRAKMSSRIVDGFPRFDEKIVLLGKSAWAELLHEMIKRADVKELTAEDFKGVVRELARFDGLEAEAKEDLLRAALKHNVREARPDLVKFLKDSQVRGRAKDALIALDARDEAPEIAKLLQDADTETRVAALQVLGGIKYQKSADAVRPLLQDKEARVRAYAVAALTEFHFKDAAPDMVKLLKDADKDTREAAAYALVEFDAKDESPKIVALLTKDETPETRRLALKLLAHLKATTAAGEILKLLDDGDKELRAQAVAALGRIKATQALPELVKRLGDPDLGEPAAQAIHHIGAESMIGDLTALLRRDDTNLRERALWVLEQIPPSALAKAWPKVVDAALVLSLTKSKDAVKHLAASTPRVGILLVDLGDKAGAKEAIALAKDGDDEALVVLNSLTSGQLYDSVCRRPLRAWKESIKVAAFFDLVAKDCDAHIVMSDRVEPSTAAMTLNLEGVKTTREVLIEACRLANLALVFEESAIRVVPKKEAQDLWAARQKNY